MQRFFTISIFNKTSTSTEDTKDRKLSGNLNEEEQREDMVIPEKCQDILFRQIKSNYSQYIKSQIMKKNMTKAGFFSLFQMLSFAAMMQASTMPLNGPEKAKGAELTFAENKCQIKDYTGKTNKKILFLAHGLDTRYLFRKDGIALQVNPKMDILTGSTTEGIDKTAERNQPIRLDIYWEGMNKDVEIYGAEEINSRQLKYIDGLNSKDCDIRNYKKLYYAEIYPGVDLRYYDRENQLKYDLTVHPGFDFSCIKMRFDGETELATGINGELIIKTKSGSFLEAAPLVLQEGKPLLARWVIDGSLVGLEIKNPNPGKELCIQTSLNFTRGYDYKM